MNETPFTSRTIAIFPLLLALKKFEEHGIENFLPANAEQEKVLALLPEALKVKYNADQIKSFISDDPKKLNQILKENGFSIKLDEQAPFDLGVVTIMDLISQWLAKATKTNVSYEGTDYPACFIKQGASIIKIDEKLLLMIRTQSGLCVFIEKTDIERSGVELFTHVHSLAKLLHHGETPCDATVPFVKMDDAPDMSWMLGMEAESTEFIITQALQQNKLTINLDGIHAESATVLGGIRAMGIPPARPKFVVDQPFNLWLAYVDPSLNSFPLFAACIGPDSWKE